MFSLLLALAQPAFAQSSDFQDDEVAEEIVVWGDLFARWDETRWMITTELGLPVPLTLYRDENEEFQATMLQIRAIFACDKDWKLSKRKYEVSCEIEDFAMKAVMDRRRMKPKRMEAAQRVLDEVDAKLTGAAMQMQVADDGRVLNIDLEGVPARNRRQTSAQETLRMVMSRLIAGYNLKMQKYNQLHQGKWVEYNSSIMALPNPGGTGTGMGSNMLVHYLNRFRGHVVVQSIGKGTTQAADATYELELIGVSIFDDREGYMTERVWAVNGKSTGATFFQDRQYFHAGRVLMLGEKDRPTCGTSNIVSGPKQSYPGLEKWVPIERPGGS